jgi:ParB family chromosome partitioning protein
MLMRGDISMGHARAVATSADPESLARQILAEGLSVRQAEARAREARTPVQKVETKAAPNAMADADIVELERQLSDLLGLRVQVKHGKSGGQVALSYSTLDQLDMICQRLSGEPI